MHCRGTRSNRNSTHVVVSYQIYCVHRCGRFGSTALHVASSFCKPDSVRILLECGADINKRDRTGNSPLHRVALSFGRMSRPGNMQNVELERQRDAKAIEVAKVLLDAGADPTLTNDGRQLAWEVAADGSEMYRLLKEAE